MSEEHKKLTRRIGKYDPLDSVAFRREGGFAGFDHAMTLTPDAVLNEVERSGLRGRGGAGFPVARKWATAADAQGQPKYLICNGDEGELGTFKDKVLLEQDPWAVLEGMLIAAYAVGASRFFVYIRHDYTDAIALWDQIAATARRDGVFAKLARALDPADEKEIEFRVARGRGLYIAGEEMALVASLAAARPMSAPKPPYPAQRGLFGCPTVVHNVETLATLPLVLAEGAAVFRMTGTENEPGTRLYSLSGDVTRPGVYEVPVGALTLREFIRDIGGGTTDGRPPKAVQPGGGTSALLGADALDCPMTDEDLRRAGSTAGTGGVIVYGQERDAVDIVHGLLEYYGRESCGRCMPCRIASVEMRRIVARLFRDEAEPDDLDRLRAAGETCARLSTCGMGQSFPVPVLSTMRLFPEEFSGRGALSGASAEAGRSVL